MIRALIAIVSLLLSQQAFAQCGEVERPIASMMQTPYNASFGIIGTPTPLPAGMYHVCGNYMLKFNPGTMLQTYHGDSGTDPNNIDTAPAGGSSNGHHVPIAGEALGALIFVEPIGCRNIQLDGNTNIYLHAILSYSPSNASMIAGGALNWCKMQ